MVHLLVRNSVEDFGKWKTSFDNHSAMRKEAGSTGDRVFHGADDPNDVLVLLEWDDTDRARTFAGSAQLREAMKEGGVVGRPEVHFLEREEAVAD